MKNMNFRLTEPILEVITRNYSTYFIPELTHLSIDEYNDEFVNYYNHYLKILESCHSIKILEIGSGIAHLAYFLNNHLENIISYDIYDFNKISSLGLNAIAVPSYAEVDESQVIFPEFSASFNKR